jgi:hypothetical protein
MIAPHMFVGGPVEKDEIAPDPTEGLTAEPAPSQFEDIVHQSVFSP